MANYLNEFFKHSMAVFLLLNVINIRSVDSIYRLSGLHLNYAVFTASIRRKYIREQIKLLI